MAQPNTAPIRYNQQRPLTTPPHVSLGDLRSAVGLTLDQLAERVAETGHPKPSRGHLSAIESGLRGPSSELLNALALAYGLRPGSVTTTYEPRSREPKAVA